jgi:predicted phage terminase large subunit-like protein
MISPTSQEAAQKLLHRRHARTQLHDFILYTNKRYKPSDSFSIPVCLALDKFLEDMQAGKRPIIVLQAPPQHGKSEIVSRKLPAYILGRFPDWRIGAASYAIDLARTMARDVRRTLASDEYLRLFPVTKEKDKLARHTMEEFDSPNGIGSYVGVGIGGGLTGKPIDIGIIDDPTKDQQEALSLVTKENHWNWYQTVFTSRLSENSGQIIMATSWAEDDLPGRILKQYAGSGRLAHLSFPAINLPDEVGYNSVLTPGALVPQLHSLEKLYETKALYSDYWWSAIYQQSTKPLGGNVFKEEFVQYYLPKDLPPVFDTTILSIDATFKDTDGTDFVAMQVWGKKGARSYLRYQWLKRMGFTETCQAVIDIRNRFPEIRTILIEDKANGPAIIDFLKGQIPGIEAVEPDGSKLARAYAVTWVWEARNIFLPHEGIASTVFQPAATSTLKHFISELTHFPAAAHDDQVDALSQALRKLYPLMGRLNISAEAIAAARGFRVQGAH